MELQGISIFLNAIGAANHPVIITESHTAPLDTKLLIKVDIGLYDARLDHYLPNGDIKLSHNSAQLIQTLLSQIRDDAIGAVIKNNLPTHIFV